MEAWQGFKSMFILDVYFSNRHEVMKIKPYPDVVQSVAVPGDYLCFLLVALDALVR